MRSTWIKILIAGTTFGLSLAGAVTSGVATAGAAAAPYTVATGGGAQQFPPTPNPFPPEIHNYIAVQAYNLPPSADGLDKAIDIPNTVFDIQGVGNLNWAYATNGVASGIVDDLTDSTTYSLQVKYMTSGGVWAPLPTVVVHVPDPATCATANVTSISNPPGAVTGPV